MGAAIPVSAAPAPASTPRLPNINDLPALSPLRFMFASLQRRSSPALVMSMRPFGRDFAECHHATPAVPRGSLHEHRHSLFGRA
jgi:hypothetical protein